MSQLILGQNDQLAKIRQALEEGRNHYFQISLHIALTTQVGVELGCDNSKPM